MGDAGDYEKNEGRGQSVDREISAGSIEVGKVSGVEWIGLGKI